MAASGAAAKKEPTYSPGLAGIYAGETKISTVGKEDVGLLYRGTCHMSCVCEVVGGAGACGLR